MRHLTIGCRSRFFAGSTGEEESLKSKLYLTTEEGDFLAADWRARPGTSGGSSNKEEGGAEAESGAEANYVEWMQIVRSRSIDTKGLSWIAFLKPHLFVFLCIHLQDHPRPCVSLQKSPFFPDIYITVGDWNFRMWKVDRQTPIFTSPNSSTYLTVVSHVTNRHVP